VRITLAGQRTQFVPPEQRFYGGGPNSVRGYGANELGPRVYVVTDTTNPTIENGDTIYNNVRTVATGGNSILLANAEVRVPAPVFPDRLRVAAFVDIGQVYERQNELFSLRAMRVTPGVGVRFTTPLGPVRVDVAYNGYDPESGTLLFRNDTTRVLVEFRPSYQRHRPAAFLRRLQLQLAIGQAF
jgi:outer membrane protein assembly factor BamA